MHIFLIIGLTILISVQTLAGDLEDILAQYQGQKFSEIKLEKKVISELFNKEKKYSGILYLTEGKFRLDIFKPESSIILFDGAAVWSIRGDGSDLGSAAVSKFVVPKNSNKGLLLGQIFYSKGLGPALKIVKSDLLPNKNTEYTLKVTDPTLTISELKIRTNKSKKKITEIEYIDEIGNKTVMTFESVKFLKTIPKNKFTYKPAKGVKVEEL